MTLPQLPGPDLEDQDYELWGQNVRGDFWSAEKMRAYAAAAIEAQQAELERLRAALTPFAAIDMASTDLPQDFAWDVLRARAALEKS